MTRIAQGFLAAGIVTLAVTAGGLIRANSQRPHDPGPVPVETRVLVGTGCEGPSDIAVAWEEDMLPRCDRIDVHTISNETTPEGGE